MDMMQKESAKPLRLILTMMLVIFVAEALVMLLFYLLGDGSSLLSGLLDASLLSVLIAVPMYFLIFRSMNRQHQQLQQSQRWLNLITSHLPEALISIDSDSTVLSFNPAAEQIFGFKADEIIGKSVNLLMDEETAREHNEYIRHYLSTGESRVLGLLREVVARRRDGRMFPVEIQVREIKLDERICFVGMLRDITRRKQEQQRREEMQDRIERAQRMESLGVMAGGIAHDFNNILAAIMGNTELLGLTVRGNDKETDACLDNIEKGCGHAADLCRQMLAYAGRGQYLLEEVDLSSLFDGMEQLIRAAVPRSIHIEKSFPADLPSVYADRGQLEQVILNLMTNAAEAIGEGEGGHIDVSARLVQLSDEEIGALEHGDALQPGPYVEMSVADNGGGILPENMPRLFEPFFTTKFTGRGLGMSAILGILRAHHGAIRIQSRPGKGSVMQVLFPTLEFEPKTSMRRPRSGGQVSGEWQGSGTVLVVDDETELRDVACRMLEHMGFDTLAAGNGEEGLVMAKAHHDRLAAVLLDFTMPVMGGDQALAALRESCPDLPVLITSGYGESALRQVFAGKKPEAFVPKPFRFSELRQILMSVARVPPDCGSPSGEGTRES